MVDRLVEGDTAKKSSPSNSTLLPAQKALKVPFLHMDFLKLTLGMDLKTMVPSRLQVCYDQGLLFGCISFRCETSGLTDFFSLGML